MQMQKQKIAPPIPKKGSHTHAVVAGHARLLRTSNREQHSHLCEACCKKRVPLFPSVRWNRTSAALSTVVERSGRRVREIPPLRPIKIASHREGKSSSSVVGRYDNVATRSAAAVRYAVPFAIRIARLMHTLTHTAITPQIEIHWGRSRNGNLFKMRLCVVAARRSVGLCDAPVSSSRCELRCGVWASRALDFCTFSSSALFCGGFRRRIDCADYPHCKRWDVGSPGAICWWLEDQDSEER